MPSRDRRDGTGCAPGRCMAGRRASPELRLFAGGVRRTTDGAEATGAELQAAPARWSVLPVIDCQNTVSCCSRAATPSAAATAAGAGTDAPSQVVLPHQRPVLVRPLLTVRRLQHPGANPPEDRAQLQRLLEIRQQRRRVRAVPPPTVRRRGPRRRGIRHQRFVAQQVLVEDASAGGLGPRRACPQESTGGPRPVDKLTNATGGELLGQACPERPCVTAGAACRQFAPARGVGTWQTQPAPISPRSMHAPSSRAARHGARLNVSAVGPGRGARGCPGGR